jgi:hypothetical protein
MSDGSSIGRRQIIPAKVLFRLRGPIGKIQERGVGNTWPKISASPSNRVGTCDSGVAILVMTAAVPKCLVIGCRTHRPLSPERTQLGVETHVEPALSVAVLPAAGRRLALDTAFVQLPGGGLSVGFLKDVYSPKSLVRTDLQRCHRGCRDPRAPDFATIDAGVGIEVHQRRCAGKGGRAEPHNGGATMMHRLALDMASDESGILPADERRWKRIGTGSSIFSIRSPFAL